MKRQRWIINFIVIVAILSYLTTSISIFILALHPDKWLFIRGNEKFIYVSTGLIGFVGGIVAAAFGITPQRDGGECVVSHQLKMTYLGGVIWAGTNDKIKEMVGTAYLWAFMIIGVISIVMVLLFGTDVMANLKNNSLVFLGTVIAIIFTYLKDLSPYFSEQLQT